uniref:Ubiquitin-like domain-containing protein n=1 Tax=Pithovirus LCPAC001 TaxID=2506585 RepID=A0A481Z1V5_9VIRU|nr:MAG: hypothetical protein LCPAC001_02220 [Pithovirus LCPAC001]
MTNVFVIFSNGCKISVTISSDLPILIQLKAYFQKESLIFMLDGRIITSNDSISSFEIRDADYIDAFIKKPAPSDEMKKHLLSEGFDISKFTFLG